MPRTYIAFVECVLNPNGHWEKIPTTHSMDLNAPQPTFEAWRPSGINAEIYLVDLKLDRRYFRFINHTAEVRIVNNVVIFDKDDVEEISSDESVQFPHKKRIDE